DKWLGAHGGELEKRWADIKADDSFTFVYTSGTTGPPKGVVLTHKNIVWECDSMKDVLPVDENDEQLLFLPMAHIFAKILEWTSIAKGSRIAFAESIAKIKDNLGEVKPTFMCAVPRVLEKVYLGILGNRNASPPTKQRIFDWAFSVGKQVSKYKQRHQPVPLALALKNRVATRLVFSKIQSVLGGRIRFLVSGGAPLSKDIAEFFHAAGVLILEGWGLTETTAGTCVNRPERYAFGTVGPAVPGVEIKIAEDGEILVRAGSVMKEYYGKPEATREVIDGDGWFHTGDIGVIEDGIVTITDRKKDIIVNAGGKNIAPQNLENALKATPYISQVMVHGDKRPYLVALVTLNEENVAKWARDNDVVFDNLGDLAKSEQVRSLVQKYVDELNAKEPSYSSIKKFAVLAQDFTQESGELTPTLKVKRKFTSEKFKDIIDAFYTN
ncbi:MAG: long-chain fatty acid--CoA ligase, partial [bacterium]|nr:long-chain fatty acid--CoA ligase [bacterium]